MIKTMIGIKILELTANGLVEIFELETEPLDDAEKQAQSIEVLTKMAFEKETMFLTTEFGSLVIRGMSTKTIVFRSVFAKEA